MSIGEHIDPWMSVTLVELQFLHDQAKKYESIVEIGCCLGRSTYALCSGRTGLVTAIDDFEMSPGCEPVFFKNLAEFKNIRFLKMKSYKAVEFVDSADMIFIDGNHEYNEVMKDLELWTPKIKKFICGHDYRPGMGWTDVDKAVDKFFDKKPSLYQSIWYYEL